MESFEQEREFRPQNMIGDSTALRVVYRRIQMAGGTDVTVLIRGEPGTGKKAVASAIHVSSRRAEKPYVKLDCAALGGHLLEGELFGREADADPRTVSSCIGRVEGAKGGTLLLDEIDFSPSVQVKLLRLLEQRHFERVGGKKTITAAVRLIATTSRNLEEDVEHGTFRQDLYCLISEFPIFLPPLRNRRDDILPLAKHFVDTYSRKVGKAIHRISPSAIGMMTAYPWPGNVRELEDCIEHAVLLSTDGVIHEHQLRPKLQMPDPSTSTPIGSLPARLALLEKEMIVDALKAARGNMTAASRQLGITARMLRYKIKKLNIDYRRFLSGDP